MSERVKPFVKWAGGKRQLIGELFEVFEKYSFNRYHEPFVGGGAVMCEMLNRGHVVSTINDINKDLITAYEAIVKSPEQLMRNLDELKKIHSRLLYYLIRRQLNQDNSGLSAIERASMFIYLNKSSFNGLYRVNSKNQFNVPIGNPFKVTAYVKENIELLSRKLNENETKIFCGEYDYIFNIAREGDLVYFDPPYHSIDDEKNFVGYQKNGFTQADQVRLRDLCNALAIRGVFVVISNHNTKYIKDLYISNNPMRSSVRFEFKKRIVSANRNVNSKASERKKTNNEIIIYSSEVF